jgi:hypothetical protein
VGQLGKLRPIVNRPTATFRSAPAARRFANNYTRLFVRYPGLEESKLGAEGMTAFEKVKFGYDLAAELPGGGQPDQLSSSELQQLLQGF